MGWHRFFKIVNLVHTWDRQIWVMAESIHNKLLLLCYWLNFITFTMMYVWQMSNFTWTYDRNLLLFIVFRRFISNAFPRNACCRYLSRFQLFLFWYDLFHKLVQLSSAYVSTCTLHIIRNIGAIRNIILPNESLNARCEFISK